MNPYFSTRISFPDLLSMNISAIDYQNLIQSKISTDIANAIMKKVEIRELSDPSTYDKIVEGTVIVMSPDEYQANYGSMHHRRGIADGTMAVMQNGHWKVLNSPRPTPKRVEQKKLSAVDYLTEKMKRQ